MGLALGLLPGQVLRVDQADEGIPAIRWQPLVIPQGAVPVLAAIDLAGLQVAVPDPVGGGIQRQAETGLVFQEPQFRRPALGIEPAQGCLRGPAFAHVAAEQGKGGDRALLVAHRAGKMFEHDLPAPVFPADRLTGTQDLLALFRAGGGQFSRNKGLPFPAEHRLRGQAQPPGGGLVDGQDLTLHAHQPDGLVGRIDQGAQGAFLHPQRLFRLLALGDVLGDAETGDQGLVVVELEIGLLPHPFDPPVGDDAVFGDIGCSALHGGAPVGVDKGAVVRVDDGEKGFMTQGGAFGQAEDPIIFIGPGQHVVAQVQPPAADVAHLLGPVEILGLVAQRLFGALERGDVLDGHRAARQLAVVIEHRGRAVDHIDLGAVEALQAHHLADHGPARAGGDGRGPLLGLDRLAGGVPPRLVGGVVRDRGGRR